MTARACLSGELACTGIAPCERCEHAMLTRVLPAAMVAGGFNGSVEVAQAFFLSYKEAHRRILDAARVQLAAAAPPAEEPAEVVKPAPPSPPTEAPVEVAKEKPAPKPAPKPVVGNRPPLTEEELEGMGQVEDLGEDGAEERVTFSPKAARAYARRARQLKAKRTGKKKKESHGSDEEGRKGSRGEGE